MKYIIEYIIEPKDDKFILYSLVTKEIDWLGAKKTVTFKNFVSEGTLCEVIKIKGKLDEISLNSK